MVVRAAKGLNGDLDRKSGLIALMAARSRLNDSIAFTEEVIARAQRAKAEDRVPGRRRVVVTLETMGAVHTVKNS